MNVFTKVWISFLKATFFTCKEGTFLLAKEECTKLALKERVRLKMHLAKCKYCQAYIREHKALAGVIDHMKLDVDNDRFIFYLTPEQEERLNNAIKQ